MPRILNINSSVVEVYWSPPGKSNGPLLEYRLYRSQSGSGGISKHIATVPATDTRTYTDSELRPQTLYGYMIEVRLIHPL